MTAVQTRSVRTRGARRWAGLARTLSNRLFAAMALVAIVLVVCAVVLLVAERDNPQVTSPVSGFSYVSRALIEGSTPWPLVTPWGRVVHEVVLITGRSVVALATGAFASKLVEVVIRKGSGMDRARVSNHIVICGWSSKGPEIIRELRAKEVEEGSPLVVLAPIEPPPVDQPNVQFLQGSPMDTDELRRANIEGAHTAIILADDAAGSADDIDARTLLTTLAVESLNPNCYTCVEVVRSENRQHFLRTSANELVVSAELTGALLASSAKTHGLSRFIGDLITHPDGSEFYGVDTPSDLVGSTFADAVTRLKRDADCLLVAVTGGDAGFLINPPSATVIGAGSRMLVVSNRPPQLEPPPAPRRSRRAAAAPRAGG